MDGNLLSFMLFGVVVWLVVAVWYCYAPCAGRTRERKLTWRVQRLHPAEITDILCRISAAMANVWGDLDLLLDSPSSLTVTSTARGTIKEKAGFKAAEDVVALRKAIEGIGRNINQSTIHSKPGVSNSF
ncbi:unnamed protein product [Coregonus sp. 'balchen']|nr:unnamed protein product [Coregonus sp. 'balchen']